MLGINSGDHISRSMERKSRNDPPPQHSPLATVRWTMTSTECARPLATIFLFSVVDLCWISPERRSALRCVSLTCLLTSARTTALLTSTSPTIGNHDVLTCSAIRSQLTSTSPTTHTHTHIQAHYPLHQ